MECCSTRTLPSIFLSAEILNKKITNIRGQLAFALLVLNTSSQAILSLSNRKMKQLDALAGDFGCQLQALNLYILAGSELLKKEMEELRSKLEELTHEVKVIQTFLTHKEALAKVKGILKQLESITVSSEMAYIFRAYLLTVTKQYYTGSDGYTYDKTDKGFLSKLIGGKIANGITPVQGQIVDIAQSCLSHQSIELLRASAHSITLLPLEKRARIELMLEDENLSRRENSREYAPKYFSCTFSNMKAILLKIREEQIPFLIKIRTKAGEPQMAPALFKSPNSGDDLQLISIEEVETESELLLVCEARIPDRQKFNDLVEKLGFYRLMLISAAMENPFDPKTSSLSDVKCEKTVKQIKKRRELAIENGMGNSQTTPFQIYHIYCSTYEEEQLANGGVP